jgi:hypothetical protein
MDVHHDPKFVKRVIKLDFVTELVLGFADIEAGEDRCDDEPHLKSQVVGPKILKETRKIASLYRSRQPFQHILYNYQRAEKRFTLVQKTYLLPNPYANMRLSSFNVPSALRNLSGRNVNGSV